MGEENAKSGGIKIGGVSFSSLLKSELSSVYCVRVEIAIL